MIPDLTVAAARTANEAAMRDTCLVQRATITKNTKGSAKTTWATVATVACRVRPAGMAPKEQAAAERAFGAPWDVTPMIEAVSGWIVALPFGTDVRPADRLIINGTQRLQVVKPLNPRTYAASVQVVCLDLELDKEPA